MRGGGNQFDKICRSYYLGATCEIMAPPSGSTGPEFGLIFVPGAQLPGDRYGPLGAEIQVEHEPPYIVIAIFFNFFLVPAGNLPRSSLGWLD